MPINPIFRGPARTPVRFKIATEADRKIACKSAALDSSQASPTSKASTIHNKKTGNKLPRLLELEGHSFNRRSTMIASARNTVASTLPAGAIKSIRTPLSQNSAAFGPAGQIIVQRPAPPTYRPPPPDSPPPPPPPTDVPLPPDMPPPPPVGSLAAIKQIKPEIATDASLYAQDLVRSQMPGGQMLTSDFCRRIFKPDPRHDGESLPRIDLKIQTYVGRILNSKAATASINNTKKALAREAASIYKLRFGTMNGELNIENITRSEAEIKSRLNNLIESAARNLLGKNGNYKNSLLPQELLQLLVETDAKLEQWVAASQVVKSKAGNADMAADKNPLSGTDLASLEDKKIAIANLVKSLIFVRIAEEIIEDKNLPENEKTAIAFTSQIFKEILFESQSNTINNFAVSIVNMKPAERAEILKKQNALQALR